MTVFVLQTLLLVFLAFVLGFIVGLLLYRLMGRKAEAVPVEHTMPATSRVAPVAPPASTSPIPREVAAEVPPPAAPKISEEPKPPVEPKKAAKSSAPAKKDDLKKIKGVGPQLEKKLNAFGISTYVQIAEWSAEQQEEFGTQLSFPGRVERDEWVKQAAILAAGGETSFSQRVERGEVESSMASSAAAPSKGKAPALLEAVPESGADDLTAIGGIGNALEKKLNALGVFTYDQVSKWNAANMEWIGEELGFPGRPERENWSEEAKALAAGNPAPAKSSKSNRGVISAKRKR